MEKDLKCYKKWDLIILIKDQVKINKVELILFKHNLKQV